MVKQTGRSCAPVDFEGFLKIACYDDLSKQLKFKCPYPSSKDTFYRRWGFDTDNVNLWKQPYSVSHICENDPYAYQACVSKSQIKLMKDAQVLCGGFFCKSNDGKRRGILTECLEDCHHLDHIARATTICPINSIKTSLPNLDLQSISNNQADPLNGFRYGPLCQSGRLDFSSHMLPTSRICDGQKDCVDNSDEKDCELSQNIEHTCTQYKTKFYRNESKTVPISNYTRCNQFDRELVVTGVLTNNSANPLVRTLLFPYCLNYLEQTNCSDTYRVGGYCNVNGYLASVSKYMICLDHDKLMDLPLSLCDDGIQNECLTFKLSDDEPDCEVHKHRMCDGVIDCVDRIDEVHDMCQFMTSGTVCERRFNVGKLIEFPISWIMDGMNDCMDSKDEHEISEDGRGKGPWRFCGNEGEKTKRIEMTEKLECKNVFMCPGSDCGTHNCKTYVKFEQLCDGLESCHDNGENDVCGISRDLPEIVKTVSLRDQNIRDLCLQTKSCEVKMFVRPWGDVFGEEEIKLYVPVAKIDCSYLFGEAYLYLSCMNLCLHATCPLKNRRLMYDSCPAQFQDRVYTLANNSFLTFVTKADEYNFRQDYFRCNNSRCVDYSQVCDLVNDCRDMSDEIDCDNHMICENTLDLFQHQFVSMSQRCDGIYDCSDLSDECNEFCGKRILENWVLRMMCWILGVLTMVFNAITLLNGFKTFSDCESEPMLYTKTLASLFGIGDFTIGLYLILLSIYDSFVYGRTFCRHQAEWLTGTACATLGVISTIGSQISIFAMTSLSLTRMTGIARNDVTGPRTIQTKSLLRVAGLAAAIITASLCLALVPLNPLLEDYFVQGMYYEPEENYKLFIGFPNKVRHLRILRTYYNTTNLTADLTWKEIGEKVDGMFSQQYGTASRRPVHFYGNDGVCLFRYFIRSNDARRSRMSLKNDTQINDTKGDAMLWLMLVVNLLCFIIISCSYLVIIVKNVASAQRSGQTRNPGRLKEQRNMQNKIALIILTDFLCWVPFIIVCIIHNLGKTDATEWYVNFAMAVLPLNSFINPLIYDKTVINFVSFWMRRLNIYGHNWTRQHGMIFWRPKRKGDGKRMNTATNISKSPDVHENEDIELETYFVKDE